MDKKHVFFLNPSLTDLYTLYIIQPTIQIQVSSIKDFPILTEILLQALTLVATTEGRPQPIFFDLISGVMEDLLGMIFPTTEVESKAGSGDMELSGDSSGDMELSGDFSGTMDSSGEPMDEPGYSGSGYY